MQRRHGWLFPMMIIAAGSVTVFGCVGIAAIMGYIPLSRTGPNPLGDYALPTMMMSPESELVTPRLARVDVPAEGTPTAAHAAGRPAARKPTSLPAAGQQR